VPQLFLHNSGAMGKGIYLLFVAVFVLYVSIFVKFAYQYWKLKNRKEKR
jgi:hypothetical protein